MFTPGNSITRKKIETRNKPNKEKKVKYNKIYAKDKDYIRITKYIKKLNYKLYKILVFYHVLKIVKSPGIKKYIIGCCKTVPEFKIVYTADKFLKIKHYTYTIIYIDMSKPSVIMDVDFRRGPFIFKKQVALKKKEQQKKKEQNDNDK